MVEVVATYFSRANKNFNCFTCKPKYQEARRSSMKGCDAPIKNPVAKYNDRIVFYRCPANFYSGYVAGIMDHARHIESGLLPYSGGLLDQPAKLVELYEALNNLRLEDENKRVTAQLEEARKNGGKSNKNRDKRRY